MHTMKHPVSAILLVAGSLNVVVGYHVVETTMHWADASQYCSDHFGSTLATFTNDDEALELRGLMDASSQSTFWIGLNDIASEGTWVFESGYDCGGNCDSLKEWRQSSNEPNNSGGKEHCGHLFLLGTETTFSMNDAVCAWGAGKAFICDDAPTTTDPTSDPTAGPTQFHCATHGCDDPLVCNTETGECERDCDVLHIDDFLLDCSAEWDSNTASSSAMAASIATNTADIATVTASAATNAVAVEKNTASAANNAAAITTVTTSANTNAAAIATNTADIAAVTGSAATNSAVISSNAADIATNSNSIASNVASIAALETEGNSVESRLSAIESTLSRMAIVSSHSAMGDVDAMTAADLVEGGSWTAVSLSGKDVVIVGMLAVNAVLITSMAVVCCRKQRKLAKYQAVSIASD